MIRRAFPIGPAIRRTVVQSSPSSLVHNNQFRIMHAITLLFMAIATSPAQVLALALALASNALLQFRHLGSFGPSPDPAAKVKFDSAVRKSQSSLTEAIRLRAREAIQRLDQR
ncbi:hypothetical protein BJX62DRAFT_71458 [Aspergillus germanicus]